MKPSAFIACALAALGSYSGAAAASPALTEELVADLALPRSPACTVCHAVNEDAGPASTAFLQALSARGFDASVPGSLEQALGSMQQVDSDGDGARDLDELYWGGDPNVAETSAATSAPPAPIYGCTLTRANAGQVNGAPWLVAAWVVELRWGLASRRRSRPRNPNVT